MLKRPLTLFVVLLFASTSSFASRGYIGNNPVKGIHLFESSSSCGPANGACLLLEFENSADGCIPASNTIAFPLSGSNYKSIEAMALISLTTGMKFRTYATRESCGDSVTLNPNGASVYKD